MKFKIFILFFISLIFFISCSDSKALVSKDGDILNDLEHSVDRETFLDNDLNDKDNIFDLDSPDFNDNSKDEDEIFDLDFPDFNDSSKDEDEIFDLDSPDFNDSSKDEDEIFDLDSPDFDNNLNDETPDVDSNLPTKYILFAHGLNSSSGVWSTFKKYAEAKKDAHWVVFATSVDPTGSIIKRASKLATYINSKNLPENSLIVVGHSMGGLDLHYIISKGNLDSSSKYAKAAKVIKKYYTLASPHKGNEFSGLNQTILDQLAGTTGMSWAELGATDAVHDLGLKQMQQFNKDYPYSTFSINGRKIPLLAIRFSCFEDTQVGDGVVAVQNQSLNGAPHTKTIFKGEHMQGICKNSTIKEEQKQSNEILDKILENYEFKTEVHDIIFYEGANCSGDEKGIFNSHLNQTVSCNDANLSHNGRCDNDEIKSVKIFPGVRKNIDIYVFDRELSTPEAYNDDWAVINTGTKDFTKAICISTFEQKTTTAMKEKGFSMFYHKGSVSIDGKWLDGKISKIKITDSKPKRIIFYEGKNCEQQVKGYFDTTNETHKKCDNFDKLGSCANDEIKSALIFPAVKKNTIIKLYDNKYGSLSDDWFFINRGSKNFAVPFCVTGLEHSTSPRESDAGIFTYWRKNNSLNGKVSYVKITTKKDSKIIFYEGSNCTQNLVGSFEAKDSSDDYSVKCSGYSGNGTCKNDEAYSMLIQPGVLKGKDIRVFDRDDFGKTDDYTTIYRGQKTLNAPFCINGFEHDTSSRESKAGITVNYHKGSVSPDGKYLNGKVSSIKIKDNM